MSFIKSARCLGAGLLLSIASHTLYAGPIFLTGHDPDFHAGGSAGARNLLNAGLDYVTGGTHDLSDGNKFLWVESRISPPPGHTTGENGLNAIGLALNTHYDRVNASELATVDFNDYTAIAIASSFGGLLGRAELDGLIARTGDIENFINGGGGLMALSECYPTAPGCLADLLAGPTDPDLYGYLPVTVSSIAPNPPFNVTTYGATEFGLSFGDLNDPTHNSFGLIGGLNPVDRDQGNQATTLAGDVTISDGGFVPTVPAPGSLALLVSGLLGILTLRRLNG